MPDSNERRSIWFIVHVLSEGVGIVGYVITQCLGMRAYAVPCGALIALGGVSAMMAGKSLLWINGQNWGERRADVEAGDDAWRTNPWVNGTLTVVIGLALAAYGVPTLMRGRS